MKPIEIFVFIDKKTNKQKSLLLTGLGMQQKQISEASWGV
jgi:hypothetical protein